MNFQKRPISSVIMRIRIEYKNLCQLYLYHKTGAVASKTCESGCFFILFNLILTVDSNSLVLTKTTKMCLVKESRHVAKPVTECA